MAKIIFTSRYFKNPKRSNVGKLVKYMGTREGVEKLPDGTDNSPATKKQQTLINSIIKNYPESKKYIEYVDYKNNSTKSNATEFIDTFIERNATSFLYNSVSFFILRKLFYNYITSIP